MYKLGQKVQCRINGEGVVVAVDINSEAYPVKVKFIDDYYETYTVDGKLYDHSFNPDLAEYQEEK